MEKLLKTMGIQKGSFYATFESKHQVLVEALRRYIRERFSSFDDLASRYPPRVALIHHFDQVLSECLGDASRLGCFLLNCALELNPRDPTVRQIVKRALNSHQAFYAKLLTAAAGHSPSRKASAKPDRAEIEASAAALLGLVIAMRVAARAGMPAAMLRNLHRQAIAIIAKLSPETARRPRS